MASNIDVTFFVPCLNEEDNIRATLLNITKAVKNISYEILVVDDGSIDCTKKRVDEFCNEFNNTNIIIKSNKINLGIGFSYFKYSLVAKGEYYILINGDNVETQESIEAIISQRGEADMIIPYFGNNDRRNNTRKLISKIFTLIINCVSFTRLKYYNGPVLHRTANVKLYRSNTFGYGYQAELITKLISLNSTYKELLINNSDRQFGFSKAFSLKNYLSVSNSIIIISFNNLSSIIQKLIKIVSLK